MSKFSKQKVMPRYFIIAVALVLVGLAVIAKAAYTMTAEKKWWAEVANNQINTADSIKLRQYPQLRRSATGRQYS